MSTEVGVLPKISFSRSEHGVVAEHRTTVVDRHGRDVTDLLAPFTHCSFHVGVDGGFARARLVFWKRGWTVDDSLDMANTVKVTHESGYDLMDGLEPNTIDQHYRLDGRPQVEITFDAEWIS